MLLAGDIGGTKSCLAIFEKGGDPRAPLYESTLPSARFNGIEALIRQFLKSSGFSADRVSLAVAGPVIDDRAAVTNLPWIVDVEKIRREFGFRSVRLMNDLAATARAIPLLAPADLHVLHSGEPVRGGVIAVLAPGTGLGEAFLTWDGRHFREHASEGGHADFAPADDLEIELLRAARQETGHVSYETLCSGPGIGRIYRFLRDRMGRREPPGLAARLAGATDATPIIVEEALADREGLCGEALTRFISILGAEAGSLALKTLATGGLYLGGGIVPRIIPFLDQEGFLQAFRRKGPMADLLCRVPVQVILDPRAALIGAADCGLASR